MARSRSAFACSRAMEAWMRRNRETWPGDGRVSRVAASSASRGISRSAAWPRDRAARSRSRGGSAQRHFAAGERGAVLCRAETGHARRDAAAERATRYPRAEDSPGVLAIGLLPPGVEGAVVVVIEGDKGR